MEWAAAPDGSKANWGGTPAGREDSSAAPFSLRHATRPPFLTVDDKYWLRQQKLLGYKADHLMGAHLWAR